MYFRVLYVVLPHDTHFPPLSTISGVGCGCLVQTEFVRGRRGAEFGAPLSSCSKSWGTASRAMKFWTWGRKVRMHR